MQKLFKANKRESAVDIVVNNIKHLLMERKLKPGDRLPSESEISEGMGVSRGSVREAMKILSAFGLVDVKVGNGTYVCEKPGSTLMDSLLLSFFVTNPDPEKLYELRQVIEIDVLEMILRHYDENTAERKALRENLNLLQKLIDKNLSLEQLKTIDLEFHHLMGSCTKNVLMERIYSIVLDFMEPTITATLKNQHGEINKLLIFNPIKNPVNCTRHSRDFAFLILVFDHSDCFHRTTITYTRDRDTHTWVAGMYNLSTAHIDRHVVDTRTVAIEYQVSRLQLRQTDLGSTVRLCTG